MRLGLFATGPVGLQVARFLAGQGEELQCLAVDAAAREEERRELIQAAGLADDGVALDSDELDEVPDLDLVVLAWWPYLVREPLLSRPRLGFLNFHPSLLPHDRGKHPNFWTLVEGTPYGVSLHWIDAGVDSGAVAFQQELDKTWEDTGETLYRRGQEAIVELFERSWPRIRAGDIPREPQDPEAGCRHAAADLEPASRIDLDAQYRARDLLNLLRARTFPPHPGAWFEDEGQRYEVRVRIERASR